jgi:hypothetical protein
MSSALPVPERDWLASLLHQPAAHVLRAYAVRCLHNAHAQASWRYRLATWTNNNTYGTDRYYCLCSTLGAAVEARVRHAKVHRPEDEFGSPFLIEFGSAALYTYRYGETASDPHEGLTLRGSWLREQLVQREPLSQGMLDYPDLPPIPQSRIVFLAWAGNRATGLERAFFARPYLDLEGKLCWLGPIEELDISEGRAFALPGIEDAKEPPRHSLDFPGIADLDAPPAFGLVLLDTDAQLDAASLFAEDPEAVDAPSSAHAEEDINEAEDVADDGAGHDDEPGNAGETGSAR